VSKGRNFYGPGGPYELFAGRECGAALGKMSFDEENLDDVHAFKSLNFGEKEQLNEWLVKFRDFKCYPIVGRLVPDENIGNNNKDKILQPQDVQSVVGDGEPKEGHAIPSIYVGCGDYYYDCSFGGSGFYGAGCSYNRFAGKDASRALAKMSFEPEDVESNDISVLDESSRKVLGDWVKTFR